MVSKIWNVDKTVLAYLKTLAPLKNHVYTVETGSTSSQITSYIVRKDSFFGGIVNSFGGLAT